MRVSRPGGAEDDAARPSFSSTCSFSPSANFGAMVGTMKVIAIYPTLYMSHSVASPGQYAWSSVRRPCVGSDMCTRNTPVAPSAPAFQAPA
eukprot:351855-Chlamydomonas_euryale.AAC.2